MALKDDLEKRVKEIFREQWTKRNGTVVPSDDSIKLNNDAVEIEGTILYADLADSTKLVDGYQPEFAAEIYKTFLHCAARIISSEGGTITAYDGDRVMAVFIGDYKNTTAVKTALKINGAAKQIIQPALKAQYPKSTFTLKHVCGVDSSKLFVAKTGIRGANDLVWVGRAANYAAKLAALDDAYPTWITKDVYEKMHESSRLGGPNKANMWEKRIWTSMGNKEIYSSKWTWSI